jgi:RHS repeat-associated protein
MIVSDVGSSKIEYYITNHLGSTVMAYSPSEDNVTYQSEYYAYGKNLNEVESSSDPVTPKFTGKERDDETGLKYFGARYYDADLAFWISVDPARQFWSGYTYSGNGFNPVNAIDPDGTGMFRFQLALG